MKYCARITVIFLFTLFFISCGNKVSYNVGDIVMDDGKVITAAQLEAYSGTAKPMAVIFSVTGGEYENSSRVLGVGYQASKPLAFTKNVKSEGSNINIMDNYSIVAAQEYQILAGKYTNAGFYGLKDGRNTWKNVCHADNGAKKNPAKYPAYDYALNYGSNNGFLKFEKGWYLPTAAEARMLAKSGIANLPQIIWTSSQGYDSRDMELVVDLTNGYVETGFKEMEYSVCSIYCFSE